MHYGEIVNLKWGDINFENRFLTLHKTKNGSRRVIPLTDQILCILKSCSSFGANSGERIFKVVKNRNLTILYQFEKHSVEY